MVEIEKLIIETADSRLEKAHSLLDRTALLIEWLVSRHPEKVRLERALESVRSADLIIRETRAELIQEAAGSRS